ncbi:hypothetical protein BDZ89DRAFT_1066332 [Hymenopellis radicata]|nr:hypothetical protein BDZ89DRAFT_1066332 [Hymenopellis radicata]
MFPILLPDQWECYHRTKRDLKTTRQEHPPTMRRRYSTAPVQMSCKMRAPEGRWLRRAMVEDPDLGGKTVEEGDGRGRAPGETVFGRWCEDAPAWRDSGGRCVRGRVGGKMVGGFPVGKVCARERQLRMRRMWQCLSHCSKCVGMCGCLQGCLRNVSFSHGSSNIDDIVIRQENV